MTGKPDGSRRNRGRAGVVLALKLAVTLGLLALILSKVELGDAFARVASASLPFLALALLVAGVQLCLLAVRWSFILDRMGSSIGLANALRHCWEASFYNLALPSGIGGDAIRMFRCHRQGCTARIAIGSVVLDRYAGVMTLLLLTAGLLMMPGHPLHEVVTGEVTVVIIAALPILALGPAVVDLIPGPWWRWKPIAPLVWLCATARQVVLHPSSGAVVLGLSLAIHICTAFSFILIGQAIAADIPLALYALVVPTSMLATMIPLSLGGWGIREGAMVGLFSLAGVPTTEALTLSVLFGLVLLALGLLGGAIGLMQPERPGSLDAKQEAD